MIDVSTYLLVDIICAVLLGNLITKIDSNIGSEYEARAFKRVILATMLLVTADAFWALGENGVIHFGRTANGLANAVYMALTGVISYLWALFSENKLGRDLFRSKIFRVCLALPLLLFIIACAASVKTGWIFYITEDNLYVRGDFYCVQVMVAYGYLLFAGGHALLCTTFKKAKLRKQECLTLASFIVLPVIGGIGQALLYGVPSTLPAISLSILFVFINFQEAQVFNDALTGLNNRRRTDIYLDSLMNNRAPHHGFYLFLMDINAFKQINDKHGHFEGDRALKLFADMLRQVSSEYKAFIARFGGDEFIMIWTPDFEQADPSSLVEALHLSLRKKCEEQHLPYALTTSIGYAKCVNPVGNLQQMIEQADKMLYENKRN